MADRPLRPATRRSLGEPLPHQQADRPRDPPEAESISSPDHAVRWGYPVLALLSESYPGLRGRFLTCYSPVRRSVFPTLASGWTSLDLHVLSTPPAFVLSQDQTLRRDLGPEGPRSWRAGVEVTDLFTDYWHRVTLSVLSAIDLVRRDRGLVARTGFLAIDRSRQRSSVVPFSRCAAHPASRGAVALVGRSHVGAAWCSCGPPGVLPGAFRGGETS